MVHNIITFNMRRHAKSLAFIDKWRTVLVRVKNNSNSNNKKKRKKGKQNKNKNKLKAM